MIPRSSILTAFGRVAVLCLANSAHATTINYPDSPTPVDTPIETTLVDPITLAIASGSAIQSGVISGDGSITKIGAGTISLTGTNTFSGPLAINAGTISASNSSALGSGDLSFDGGTLTTTTGMVLTKNTTLNAGGATFALSNGFFTLNGNVSGPGDLTKNGTSILTLNGAHTYTGATTVNGGTLKFGANGATASTVATSSLAIASGARVIFADSQTYAGGISGAGVLEHEFSGTTILTGAATHAGGTNITGGTIQVGNGGTTGSLAGNVALIGGGTLAFNRSDALTYSGNATGTGSLSQLGGGTLTLSGTNVFANGITLAAGTLALGSSGAIGTTGTITFNGGALQSSAANTTDYSARFSTAAGQAYRIDTNGQSVTLASNLTSSGGTFTKLGAGTAILSGNNTFSGGTTINAGTLGFDNANALGSGAITLGGGALQASSADLAVANAINATVGTSSGIDTNGHTITVNGAISGTQAQIVKTGAGTLAFTAATNHVNSFFVNGGDVHQSTGAALTSYELGIGSGSGNTGVYNIDGGTLTTLAGTPPQPAGGSASSFRVGDFGGTGTVNQTGGIVTNNGSLNIGNQGGHGTYNLSAGELHLASGQSTLGRTNGGSTSSGGSTGALNLSGTGTLSIENDAILTLSNWYGYTGGGTQGSGVLTQTGGTLAVANTATLNLAGSGSGTYNLNGGTLQVGGSSLNGNYFGQSGAYQFNLGGGTIQVTGANLATGVNATLTNATTSTINTNGLGATFSGVLSGTGGLLKTGAGTLTLSGANTYTGATVVSGGTLALSGAGTIGAGFQVNTGGTLDLGGKTVASIGTLEGGTVQNGTLTLNAMVLHTGTLAANVVGTGGNSSMMKTGTGTVTISGNVSLENAIFIKGGQIVLGSADTGTASFKIDPSTAMDPLRGLNISTYDFDLKRLSSSIGTVRGSGVYRANLAEGSALKIENTLTGTASLVKEGAGTLRVASSFGYSGGTTLNAGTISFGWTNFMFQDFSASLGFGPVTINGGSLQSIRSGSTLNNSMTFAGDFTLGRWFTLSGNVALAADVTLTSANDTVDTVTTSTLSGTISGAHGITFTEGTNPTGSIVLSGANTYTGPTTINAGTVRASGGSAIPDNSAVTLANVSSAALALSANETIGSLTGGGATGGNVALGASTLTTGGNNASTAFGGVISGTGGLVKQGTGTQTLSGTNTYTGATTINAGKLVVDGSIAASTLTTINNTGTLGGHGTVGPVTINIGGTISPGNSPGTLNTGDETWTGGGGYVWELNNASDAGGAKGVTYDWLNIGGALDITATSGSKFKITITSLTAGNIAGATPGFVKDQTYTFTIATATSPIANFSADKFLIDTSAFFNDTANLGNFSIVLSEDNLSLNLTYTAIPEPAEWGVMLAAVLCGMILLRRRNSSRK